MSVWSRKKAPRLVPLDERGSAPARQEELDSAGEERPSRDRFFWPLQHRSGDRDRGTRHALRAVVFVMVLLGFANLFQAASFSALLPLKRDVPYFLEDYAEERSVVEVKPARRLVDGNTEEAKREVARFVRVMFEVKNDLGEMDRRWGPGCAAKLQAVNYSDEFDLLCSYIYLRVWVNGRETRAWQVFRDQLGELKSFIDAGKSRTVTMLGSPIKRDDTTWEVRVELTDYKALGPPVPGSGNFSRERDRVGQVEKVNRKAIFLKARFGAGVGQGKEMELRLNPLRFLVEDIIDIVDITE